MIDLEYLAMVLSVVSLALTGVGFFASLHFYREGKAAQDASGRTLAIIEERAGALQGMVGGLFEKTLDAAISKGEPLAERFEELRRQITSTSQTLLDTAVDRFGESSQEDRSKLELLVKDEMEKLRLLIDRTEEAADEIQAEREPISAHPGSVQHAVLIALSVMDGPVSPSRLVERASLSPGGFTFVIDALKRKGYVTHVVENGVAGLVLTESGRAALSEAEG